MGNVCVFVCVLCRLWTYRCRTRQGGSGGAMFVPNLPNGSSWKIYDYHHTIRWQSVCTNENQVGNPIGKALVLKIRQWLVVLPNKMLFGLMTLTIHPWPIYAKIKVAVSVDKQRTLIRIYMEKYNSVWR